MYHICSLKCWARSIQALQIIMALLLLASSSYAAQEFPYPFQNDEEPKLYGYESYINGERKIIILPKFMDADNFSPNGLAFACVGNDYNDSRCGYIDISGRFVIAPSFGHLHYSISGGFAENGLAAVRPLDQKNCGYIDGHGNYAIQPQYSDCTSFRLADPAVNLYLAAVKDDSGKERYINPSGEYLGTQVFDEASPFDGGLARVKVGTKYGAIDSTGRYVIPPEYTLLGIKADAPQHYWAYANTAGTELQGNYYKNAEGCITPDTGYVTDKDKCAFLEERLATFSQMKQNAEPETLIWLANHLPIHLDLFQKIANGIGIVFWLFAVIWTMLRRSLYIHKFTRFTKLARWLQCAAIVLLASLPIGFGLWTPTLSASDDPSYSPLAGTTFAFIATLLAIATLLVAIPVTIGIWIKNRLRNKAA